MGNSRIENPTVSHEEVSRRAYEIWESRGRPEGDGSQDWDAALAELTSQRPGVIRHWWERLRRSIAGRDS